MTDQEPDPDGLGGNPEDEHRPPETQSSEERPATAPAASDSTHAADGPDEATPRDASAEPDQPTQSQRDDGTLSPTEVPTMGRLSRLDDRVEPLDGDRFVVGASDEPPAANGAGEPPERDRPETADPPGAGEAVSDARDARERGPEASLPELGDGAYAVSMAVRTDQGVAEQTFSSDDISAVFGDVLRWYAHQIEPDRDPATVLSVLMDHANLED
jgi:hypothetical protein